MKILTIKFIITEGGKRAIVLTSFNMNKLINSKYVFETDGYIASESIEESLAKKLYEAHDQVIFDYENEVTDFDFNFQIKNYNNLTEFINTIGIIQ